MPNFGHFTLFFQSFPTKVVQNDFKCSILIISHFFPSFPTKVVQNDLQCSILVILHFFQSLPTKMVQNDSECPIFSHQSGPKQFRMLNFDHFTCPNLFPPKWSQMIWNAQFCLFCTFPNLFPPKWCKMIQNT